MRRKIPFYKLDKLLLLAPIIIFFVGLGSIYSTSVRTGQFFDQTLVMKQILWMGIGVLLVFLTVRIPYFKLLDYAWPIYFVSIFLLLAVLFTPARLGAHRWINVGGFNLQPSEVAKVAVIFILANFFMNNRSEYISKEKMMIPFLAVGLPFLLILKEPDLGTGLTMIPVLFAMLYLWGFKPKYMWILFCAAALFSPLLFHFLKDYQKARLLVFINPNADPLGAGYTIIQSKIAIGSGGFLGRGFLSGSQNQLNFVPENHTDFIFAVIAEEGGFIISFLVLSLFWLIVYRGYQIAAETSDRFGSQLACGLTTLLGAQALINFGMTMGLLPVVGVPLPLVSYGGSSVIATMTAIALLINIKIHRPTF